MAKFQYMSRPLEKIYEGGPYDFNDMNEFGENHWELVAIKGETAFFKRSYDDSELSLNNIDYEMERMIEKLNELKARETILVSLVQDLVEKIYPESAALSALKEMTGQNDNGGENL